MWWNRHYLGSFFNQAKCLTNRGALVQVGLLSGGRHYLVRFTAYIIQEARLDKYNNSKIEIQEFILLTSINPLLIISFFNNPCEKKNQPCDNSQASGPLCLQALMLQPALPHYFLGTLALAVLLHFRLRLQVFLGCKPAFPSVQRLVQLCSDPWLQELGLRSTIVAYADIITFWMEAWSHVMNRSPFTHWILKYKINTI